MHSTTSGGKRLLSAIGAWMRTRLTALKSEASALNDKLGRPVSALLTRLTLINYRPGLMHNLLPQLRASQSVWREHRDAIDWTALLSPDPSALWRRLLLRWPSRAAVEIALKRLADVLIASAALLAASPVLVVAAAAIYLQMGRPIFFSHERIGEGGRRFACLKFRTMVTNVKEVRERHLRNNPAARRMWQERQKLDPDPAVTPLGQFLRNSSIDELPQLVNVLRGEMSCVGPRPVTEKELIERYGIHRRHYLRVRPGLTGLWQVNGRNSVSYRRRIALDCYYVRKHSLQLDAKILARTIPALLRTEQTS